MAIDVSRAVWVVTGDDPAQLASYRYVALIPVSALGARGVGCEPETDPGAFLDLHGPSALVLGKAFHAGFVALAQAARVRGIPVLAALCDWHFDNPINIALGQIADAIVVPTQAMADAVRQHFQRPAVVIEDPYEGPRAAPAFAPGDPIRLLWFGHSANHDTLAAGIAQVGAGFRRNLHVQVITNQPENVGPALSRLPRLKATIQMEAFEWSLAQQWRLLAGCDAVLLPSHPGRDKLVRGHNRLVQTIHAGRLALAYALPAYRELAAYCWCGKDLGLGLNWALAHRAAAAARIAAGQAYIDGRFAPARIAGRWAEEIERAATLVYPPAIDRNPTT